MRENRVETAFKGFLVGGTMLVPGVSGGSMAILMGIYDRLIGAVASFGKAKKENFLFLLTFSAGAAAGMLLFARPLEKLLEAYPAPVACFFLGAAAGGVPVICRKGQLRFFTPGLALWLFLGTAAALGLSCMPLRAGEAAEMGENGWLLLLAAGLAAAAALILPGISVSYFFLMLGLYELVLEAVAELRLSVLIPLGAGLFLGILAVAGLLETVMERYPRQTYGVILGFVLASLAEIFPGMPVWKEIPICALTLVVGFFFTRLMPGE